MSSKRLVKSKSGLKMVSQHEKDSSPWDIPEPPWVPDKEAHNCITCNAKFDFVRRKHHCRRCGRIFCSKCCSAKVQFHRMGFVDPVRHCNPCAGITKIEEDFFTNQMKILFEGAPFHVSRSSSAPSTPSSDDLSPTLNDNGFNLFHCKLSSDQRSLIFGPFDSDCGEINLEPIEISRILTQELFFSENDDKKGPGSGLLIQFRVASSPEVTFVRLLSPAEPSRKPSVAFISALQKGLTMTMESQKFNPDDEL